MADGQPTNVNFRIFDIRLYTIFKFISENINLYKIMKLSLNVVVHCISEYVIIDM